MHGIKSGVSKTVSDASVAGPMEVGTRSIPGSSVGRTSGEKGPVSKGSVAGEL